MSFDHAVSLASTLCSFVGLICSFIGLMFVALQIRDATRQRETESIVKLYDANRQLLSLGFEHPALLKILEDKKIADPVMQKRYLQMWLNQLSQMHLFQQRSVVHGELQDELRRNLEDFMSMDLMRKHWHEYGSFYPQSFQRYVNDILKKDEPPPAAAAHLSHKGSHAVKT